MMEAVSILVLLDVSPKVQTPCGAGRRSRFQSLFCWMFLRRSLLKNNVPFSGSVSILVLLDVSPKADLRYSTRSGLISFNPCSVGCFSEGIQESIKKASNCCFNPCSVGCFSEGVRPYNLRFASIVVSILVLLDVSPKVGKILYLDPSTGFQSLFCWMFLRRGIPA